MVTLVGIITAVIAVRMDVLAPGGGEVRTAIRPRGADVPPSSRRSPAGAVVDTPVVDTPPRQGPEDASSPRVGPERTLVPRVGGGIIDVVPVSAAAGGRPDTDETTYSVELERGLPFPARTTAQRVDATLADARGWSGVGVDVLRRTATAPDFRILLASPGTTDELCAPLQTRGKVSCRNGGLVVVNAERWASGTADYRDDLTGYRRYVVNHEVGHALGYGHVLCPGPGRPAPVMMQQTYGLRGCTTNPWPSVA